MKILLIRLRLFIEGWVADRLYTISLVGALEKRTDVCRSVFVPPHEKGAIETEGAAVLLAITD